MGDEGLEKTRKSPGNKRIGSVSGAQSGAVGADCDPELARIVEAWPGLPAGVRRKVLAIVEGSLEVRADG